MANKAPMEMPKRSMLHQQLQDRYLLEEEVGQGGMGRVYRARDTLLGRSVAVKIVSQIGLGTEGRSRLLIEAQAAARLNHPNVITIYDAGEDDGLPFLVMELVNGRALDASKQLSYEPLLDIGVSICRALAHAHYHGIIHRDLKPQNIFITAQGQVKLMDFGLAQIQAASRLTQKGTIMGTFAYMAPELLRDQPASVKSDLYSLGVVLYELATGRLLFTGENLAAILQKTLHAPVEPPTRYTPSLPEAFEQLILRLLAKEPASRPETAEEVLQELLTLQSANGGLPLSPPSELDSVRIKIQLLGGFRLIYQDRPYQGVSRPQLQALLAYLLLNRNTPQSRTQLAYHFWPDSTDRQARTNLRKALYLLRDNLPEFERFIAVDANEVQWLPDTSYHLDVAAFEDRLEQSRQQSQLGKERVLLEEALALYQGPLFPD